MSSNWPIYGAKSPMTAELVRVVADRPKENPEARDLRGLGGGWQAADSQAPIA